MRTHANKEQIARWMHILDAFEAGIRITTLADMFTVSPQRITRILQRARKYRLTESMRKNGRRIL